MVRPANSRVFALLVLLLAACSAGPASQWTTLEVDGAKVPVPEGWRLEWSGRTGVKWAFLLYQDQQQRLVQIWGADMSSEGAARPWLAWFANEVDDQRSTLEFHEYSNKDNTVVCAIRGSERIFAACVRRPTKGGPLAAAVVFVLNQERTVFETHGGLSFLSAIASHSEGFDYILCVVPRGEVPARGCEER
jgi:hypothetical protein